MASMHDKHLGARYTVLELHAATNVLLVDVLGCGFLGAAVAFTLSRVYNFTLQVLVPFLGLYLLALSPGPFWSHAWPGGCQKRCVVHDLVSMLKLSRW